MDAGQTSKLKKSLEEKEIRWESTAGCFYGLSINLRGSKGSKKMFDGSTAI